MTRRISIGALGLIASALAVASAPADPEPERRRPIRSDDFGPPLAQATARLPRPKLASLTKSKGKFHDPHAPKNSRVLKHYRTNRGK